MEKKENDKPTLFEIYANICEKTRMLETEIEGYFCGIYMNIPGVEPPIYVKLNRINRLIEPYALTSTEVPQETLREVIDKLEALNPELKKYRYPVDTEIRQFKHTLDGAIQFDPQKNRKSIEKTLENSHTSLTTEDMEKFGEANKKNQ